MACQYYLLVENMVSLGCSGKIKLEPVFYSEVMMSGKTIGIYTILGGTGEEGKIRLVFTGLAQNQYFFYSAGDAPHHFRTLAPLLR